MYFDEDKKSLDISIREIAFSAASSNGEKYISRRLRARIGHQAHSRYQDTTDGETEYYIRFTKKIGDWSVLIRGRVDVVTKNGNKVHLEEIKSTTGDIDNLEEDEAYIMQLQLYAHYFYKIEGYSEISAFLVMIDPVNNKERKIEINPKPMGKFLSNYLSKLIKEYQQDLQRKEELKKRVTTISFPFKEYRPYQEEIIEKITDLLPNHPRIMLHAPPGIGKTITTFYPALKYGISEGKRVFVITSKTTQQRIYTETMEELQKKGAEFKSIRITAKGKMCHTDQFDCYDMDCPYLENYFRSDQHLVISDLLELDMIDREPVEQQAESKQICPFELSLDVAMYCDVVLSDFNYIFHPRVRFQRFQEEFEDSILIVDEAHNLVSRAAEFYSEVLSIEEIQQVMDFIISSQTNSRLKYKLKIHLKRLIKYIQRLKDQIVSLEMEHSLVNLDRDFFRKFQAKLDELAIEYINSLPIPPQKKDELIKFSDHLKFFTLLLEESDEPEFEEIYDIDQRQTRIFCKSAAKKLEEQIKGFDSVIVQSATLEPLQYYHHMLGLPDDATILRYSHPFSKENRLYLIDPSISTTYKERYLFLDELATTISRICRIREGNYLVFFSSFEYLNKVKNHIKKKTTKTIMTQSPDMSDTERDRLLRRLRNEKNLLVLAVMGGIFSEGVDYTGEMAIGAFIVGPGLPKITFDQELKKDYFDATYSKGFDYAYKFPGMAKVIQSAGRVFRSEIDRGFVIFMGHRFSTEQYQSVLPDEFELKDNDLEEHVTNFWRAQKPNRL